MQYMRTVYIQMSCNVQVLGGTSTNVSSNIDCLTLWILGGWLDFRPGGLPCEKFIIWGGSVLKPNKKNKETTRLAAGEASKLPWYHVS